MKLLLFLFTLGVLAANVNADVCYVKGLFSPIQPGKTFRHPENKCIVCLCCENGKYSCRKRQCDVSQPCGISKQTEYSPDGCCKRCCEECLTKDCGPPLPCDKDRQAYKHNKCCPVCGCKVDLGNRIVAVPPGKFGHVCENCKCREEGNKLKVKCNRPPCPSDLLNCINPTFDDNCDYVCPTGEMTCRRNSVIIDAGTFVSIKFKVCTCNTENFYPRGFCANSEDLLGNKFLTLKYEMCVADAMLPPVIPNYELDLQGP